MSAQPIPSVAILLATHNGLPFLAGQLESIATQTHVNWRVWASDDGSSDGTVDTLEQYGRMWGGDRLVLLQGPNRGVDENFRALIGHAAIDADVFAYADQDDVWLPDKIERAVRWFAHEPSERPALYCARTSLIDRQGRPIGRSPLFARPPSFANALVQNLAGGNTMLFNRAARQLLRDALPASANVVIYDWWTYLLVTGAGGAVRYDAEPTVLYRQHERNLVGANARVRDRIDGLRRALTGRLRAWNDRHVAALGQVASMLTPDNRVTLTQFAQARQRGIVPRLVGFRRAGIYRQTTRGNVALTVAALLNRV